MPSSSTHRIIDTNTAAEFWDHLSPQKLLFPKPCNILYRGQADSTWPLVPSILRAPHTIAATSDDQIFYEFTYLESFVRYCDSTSLAIPHDSLEFRERFLSLNAPAGPGGVFVNTSTWPPPQLHELIALGQHHGLPTRLLDWTTRSYVAAYFAISDALAKSGDPSPPDRLAVWVLNIELLGIYPDLQVLRIPGSNNANIAAQAGRLTLLRQAGTRGKPFLGETSLDAYLAALSSPVSLLQVTLPLSEARAALGMCELYGISGATMFPDYTGAARAAKDLLTNTNHP